MRLPSSRPALLAFLALALSTATYAQYVTDSSSAQSQQRSLEKYGRELRDSIRSQRNTPSPRYNSGPTSGELQMRAEEAAREAARESAAAQRRADADWRRDHPNETRAAYYARMDRERKAAEEANARAWEEYRRVQRERTLQQIAEKARLEQLEWDRYRPTVGFYTSRARHPFFTTTTQALTWCRAHDGEGFNNWASVISALLLMDGLGVPRDLSAASAFADPQRPFAPGSEPVHPNLQAIYLYLSTSHPELYAHHPAPPTAADSRRELVLLAKTNPRAKWLLARLLAQSSDPADQRQAILFLPYCHLAFFGRNMGFATASEGDRLVEAHLKKTTWEILQRGVTSLPAILATWTPEEFAELRPIFRDPPAHTAATSGTDAIPRVLALIQPYVLLNGFAENPAAAPDPLYATDAPTFDLARASARFASAYAPGTSRLDAQLALLEAARLGDAFAPLALISMLGERSLKTDTLQKLRATATARRARDDAAGHPRALAARLIEARFEERAELKPVFTQAIAAGSILAPRARLSQKIDVSMARQNDRPPSWELPPALIAELDAAVVELNARPDRFHEWSLFPLFLTTQETTRVAYWFQGFDLWEKDRQERLADAELIRVIQPQIDAVLATLSDWPGFDPYNAQRSAQLEEARQLGYKADKLVTTDGTEALVLYLQAAALGDRVALDRLAGHIRRGTGQLPRSAEFSDRLTAVTFKMIQGDAEVGDAYAASFLGSSLLSGRFIAKDRAAGLDWLRHAAGLGDRDATSLLAGAYRDENPAEARHWAAVGEIIQYGENLLVPPRRLQGSAIDLTSILPALETALTAAERRLAGSASVTRSEADEEALGLRYENACTRLQSEPTTALVEIAQTVADGDRYAPFTLGQLLTGGRFGFHPALARRFHAVGLAHLKQVADRGDLIIAHRLGQHYLDLLEKPDPVAAIGWFTYSAELGNNTSASTLAEIYTHGAPGITPDPATARRWQAIALEIDSDQYLSAPARVISGPKTPLTALRASLQRALEAARLASTQAQAVPEGDAVARKEAADVLFKTDPAAALLVLTRLAGEGRGTYAFAVADILSSGTANYGYNRAHFEPDPELARQFQTAGRALLVAEAERGDAETACQIGRRLLNPIDEKPDITLGIRWLTYAAERGSSNACEELAKLYTGNQEGIPPDPAAAAHWTAFAKSTKAENFKPRAPLR